MNQTPKNFADTRDLDPSQDAAPLESTELYRTSQDSAEVGILIGGKYKQIQRIGEGGMGTVWLAEKREPVRRKVAVKLVKAFDRIGPSSGITESPRRLTLPVVPREASKKPKYFWSHSECGGN